LTHISNFLKAFFMKRCWIFASIEKIKWFLLFFLYMYCFTFIDLFMYIEPFLHSWKETNLIMVYDFCNMLLNLVFKNLIGNFLIYVHKGIWFLVFLFCCCALMQFLSQVILASQNEFSNILFYGIVWGAFVLGLL
jgi:hypothetical protein